MPNLMVVALISAKEGSSDTVRDALRLLVPPTRDEEGCVGYDLYESQTAPGTFVTVETWRGQSDLDAHMTTQHIADAFAAVGDALSGPPAIHALTPIAIG